MKNFIDEIINYHLGHKYIVRLQQMGHRCGYVKVNNEEIYQKIADCYWNFDLDKYSLAVHGGITLVEKNPISYFLPDGCWIGFDCNHLGDLPDFNALLMDFDVPFKDLRTKIDDVLFEFKHSRPTIRTKEYVEAECKNLINQLVQLGDGEVEHDSI